jgi:hypothetical protein
MPAEVMYTSGINCEAMHITFTCFWFLQLPLAGIESGQRFLFEINKSRQHKAWMLEEVRQAIWV